MNTVIGSSEEPLELGRQRIYGRRQSGEPHVEMWVCVVRETTWEAYYDFHVAEGLRFEMPIPGERYYEVLVD